MSLFKKIFQKTGEKLITIDGEYGSGANEIAKKVADKLNYEFYDEKLIELTSLEKKVKPEEIKKDDSFLQGTIYDLYRQNYSYSQEDIAVDDAAFLLDSRTIRELAKKKKTEGLTPEEAVEQAKLREEYIAGYRRAVRHHIEGIKIVDEEGNDVTPEKLRQVQREKGLHGRSLDDPES